MGQFIFVRHGQSEANAAGIIADASYKLTEVGVEQAQATGALLVDHGISRIVTSPYIRAQQTAEEIAGVLGIGLDNIFIIDELRERGLGELENMPKDRENEWYLSGDDTARGVETRQSLIDRMRQAMVKINELQPAEGTILVAGHAISGYYLQQVAKGFRSFEEFDELVHMNNAGYAVVDYLMEDIL